MPAVAEITVPTVLVLRSDEIMPVTARLVEEKLVVVALVPVAVVKRKFVRVDEAVERKPFWNERVVEVAFSPEPRVVDGKAKPPPPPQPVQLVTVRAPMLAMLARSCVVEARPET